MINPKFNAYFHLHQLPHLEIMPNLLNEWADLISDMIELNMGD